MGGTPGAQQVARGHPGVHREAAGTASRESLPVADVSPQQTQQFNTGSKAHSRLPLLEQHKTAKIGDRGPEEVKSLWSPFKDHTRREWAANRGVKSELMLMLLTLHKHQQNESQWR